MSFKKHSQQQTLVSVISVRRPVCQGAACSCQATVVTKHWMSVIASVSTKKGAKNKRRRRKEKQYMLFKEVNAIKEGKEIC